MAIVSRTNLEVLNRYTSRDWETASGNLGVIRPASLDVLGYVGVSQCLEALRPQVATITFLAGSGTRWVNSFPETEINWDKSKPRCLYPVEDVLAPGTKIPIGVYNLRPLIGLGSHYIVWGTHEQEIDDLVNMSGLNSPQYFHQSDRGFDKPLGHGDAMLQLMPYVSRDIKYVIANFGGDVNSRETIETSLMVLAAICIITGVSAAVFFRSKRYWLKVHKAFNSSSAFLLSAGVFMALMSVWQQNGEHLAGIHPFIGIIALGFTIASLFLGFYQFKAKNRMQAMKTLHRWLGRLSVILVIAALVSGLFHAGII